MQAHIGIHTDHLQQSAQLLASILADEYLLYTKTRNAHWNVEGTDFHEKHLFFEAQYTALDDSIDSIAERIRSLGHYAPASLKQFLQLTHLTEEPFGNNDSISFIRQLLSDHENIIVNLRKQIVHLAEVLHDMGSSDFVTGLMENHEKMAWMLRAHLKQTDHG